MLGGEGDDATVLPHLRGRDSLPGSSAGLRLPDFSNFFSFLASFYVSLLGGKLGRLQ